MLRVSSLLTFLADDSLSQQFCLISSFLSIGASLVLEFVVLAVGDSYSTLTISICIIIISDYYHIAVKANVRRKCISFRLSISFAALVPPPPTPFDYYFSLASSTNQINFINHKCFCSRRAFSFLYTFRINYSKTTICYVEMAQCTWLRHRAEWASLCWPNSAFRLRLFVRQFRHIVCGSLAALFFWLLFVCVALILSFTSTYDSRRSFLLFFSLFVSCYFKWNLNTLS